MKWAKPKVVACRTTCICDAVPETVLWARAKENKPLVAIRPDHTPKFTGARMTTTIRREILLVISPRAHSLDAA